MNNKFKDMNQDQFRKEQFEKEYKEQVEYFRKKYGIEFCEENFYYAMFVLLGLTDNISSWDSINAFGSTIITTIKTLEGIYKKICDEKKS